MSVNPILVTVSPTGEVQHVFFLQFNMDTVNPLLSPPGAFQALFFGGGGLNREGGGLFNLAKCITCSKNLPPVYQQLSRSRTSWTFAYRIIISAV